MQTFIMPVRECLLRISVASSVNFANVSNRNSGSQFEWQACQSTPGLNRRGVSKDEIPRCYEDRDVSHA